MKIKIITFMILLCIAGIANATIVDITVATDKESYLLGEEVIVSVTAYNPNPEPVTLTGGFYFASYIMDGIYDWVEGRSGPPVIIYLTIEPDDSFTWNLTHGSYEMQEYPLALGIHTVVGQVLAVELIGDGTSASSEFEVIPEPSTFLLLVIGIVLANAKQRHKLGQNKNG